MSEDIVYKALGVFITTAVVAVILLIGGALVDEVQQYRSFDARAACEMRMSKPVRRFLSTDVRCVPYPTRRDTTSVQVLP